MNTRTIPLIASLMLSASFLQASPVTKVADANETIESGGPSGTPWFHNSQANGDFEEYAISSFSFTAADFGLGSVTAVPSAQISYMQGLAFFAEGGPLEFFVSFDTTVGSGSYGALTHDGSATGILDTQFSDAPSTQSIGTGTFTQVADGTVDTYVLNFSGAVETALVNAINNGNPFSILMAAPSGSTAATYSGLESFDFEINGGSEPDVKRTSLTLNAIPEPSTLLIMLMFGLGLILYRNRTPS